MVLYKIIRLCLPVLCHFLSTHITSQQTVLVWSVRFGRSEPVTAVSVTFVVVWDDILCSLVDGLERLCGTAAPSGDRN